MALCFSAWEKNRELVHNCAVLIGKDGALVGKYRKVHLASPLEVWWGVTPGHEFPVYEVDGARVTMNICMDSSALESARVPARLGAEILCLPIMGDHRAQRYWNGLDSDFEMDRWLAIQRTRAMDNQLWMVISRNNGNGTGIFAPDGNVLALAADKRLVHADVDLSALPRTWTWATFRNVAWWERREPTYCGLMASQDRNA
jgi:predicted amidohydrolase